MVISNPTAVTVPVTANYYLVAENSFGCKDTAQVTVNIENPQTPNIQSGDFTDCSLTLNLGDYEGMPSQTDYTLEWHNANNTLPASLLSNLIVGTGTYYLFEKSPNGCYSASTAFVVTDRPGCFEVCNNGIDDDGDGLVDCDDTECKPAQPGAIIKN